MTAPAIQALPDRHALLIVVRSVFLVVIPEGDLLLSLRRYTAEIPIRCKHPQTRKIIGNSK